MRRSAYGGHAASAAEDSDPLLDERLRALGYLA
jgi:hypothetical protein